MKQGRRSREEWQAIVQASEERVGSLEAFASAEGLNSSTLSYWRAKFRRESRTAEVRPGRFVEVSSAASAPVSVTVGSVRIECVTLPPAEWIAALSARC